MRVLLLDIDSLRPDHLGCYGYGRETSPNIDRVAAQGTTFENCFVSDTPCGPSRTGFITGICGTRNGVVAHSGPGYELFVSAGQLSMPRRLQEHGIRPVTISSFADR